MNWATPRLALSAPLEELGNRPSWVIWDGDGAAGLISRQERASFEPSLQLLIAH